MMLLGIDVGGTFTDAVLIANHEIVAQAKSPTTHEQILQGILQVIDKVLVGLQQITISRIVISSTIVTNSIAEGKIDPVLLVLMPGVGMNLTDAFPVEPYFVKGYVDHRGKVLQKADIKDEDLAKKAFGKKTAVISGKFAVRNQANEKMLLQKLQQQAFDKIFLGSVVSGELNFVRRTNSAYFSAAVYNQFKSFCEQVEKSLQVRNISAPIQILKADGGTLPLDRALEQPVETIFTGPAASVLGIEVLTTTNCPTVSLDVGGTTTDIAFWAEGLPLLAKKGAKIEGFTTAVRSFHMCSLGIGGDSFVQRVGDGFDVEAGRRGYAMAVGGSEPTLSDALIVAGYTRFGDASLAQKAMEKLAVQGEDITIIAKNIVKLATAKIEAKIKLMIDEWNLEPVYTVGDVINKSRFKPQLLIGVGGGAPGLVKALGEQMNLPISIPTGGMVANALGAALARPTLVATLRADTTEGYYTIPKGGIKGVIRGAFNRKMAEELLGTWILEQVSNWHLENLELETLNYEEFPVIHDYYTTGKIIYVKMQLKAGILARVHGQEVAF